VRYGSNCRSAYELNDAGEPAVRSLCPDGREEAQFTPLRVTRADTRPALDEIARLVVAERQLAIAERGFSGVEVDLIDPPDRAAVLVSSYSRSTT
jgi:hypothetical protein